MSLLACLQVLFAGVPCVVSSLWSVPDISTAILMERFYSNHIAKGMDIPLSLQEAQLWVRDLTSSQVADCIEKCYKSSKWEGKSKEIIEQLGNATLKWSKNLQKKSLFSIHTIGQLLQLMEHKIRSRFNHVYMLEHYPVRLGITIPLIFPTLSSVRFRGIG